MPVLNVMCPICTEVYTNADDVHSTSCGHLFHYSCLNAWIRRENNCPQCRHPNPSVYKQHLSFEEIEPNAEAENEFRLKLTSSDEKVAQLQDQLAEASAEFLQLQQQFNVAENAKLELEEDLSKINDFENEFLRLQGEYTDSSELIKDMEDRINQLFIEHECKLDELRRAKAENDALKTRLEKKQNTLSDDLLSEKLMVLERKLKHVSIEFQKEIETNTQLSIQKEELQNRISLLNSREVLKEQQHDKKPNMPKRDKVKKASAPKKDLKENVKPTDDTFNVVLIKQMPLSHIWYPLESFIVRLAAEMKLSISADDLLKVQLLNCTNKQSTKAQVIVQFKLSQIKDTFISNRHKLKLHKFFNCVVMDDMHELFTYAQEKLLNYGFSDISCRNYRIFARKESSGELFYIQSKTNVDKLVEKSL